MMKMTPKTTMQKGLLKRPLLRQMFFFRRQKRRDRLFCPKIVCMRRFCAKHNASHAQIIANAAQQMPQRDNALFEQQTSAGIRGDIFVCFFFN